jgi:NAD(P)-dependent dehydrogenase (short-subunit alcohol dehydrogenase family)
VLKLNVVGAVAMTQAVVPALRLSGGGRIVDISSGTTNLVLPGVGAYAATKAALNMISAVARWELEPDGITVSLVLPFDHRDRVRRRALPAGRGCPAGVVAHSPEHVAGVIVRVLRTGKERVDIAHGPEQPELTAVPGDGS